MKPLLCLLALFCTVATEPTKLPLWPDKAPGSHGDQPEDQPWLDVWLAPRDQANGAAFVIAPGGGYGGLALDHEGVQVARYMNSLGVAAFVLHYRLGAKGYHHPTQLLDVQRAIRLVRSKAGEYAIDPGRVGILGFSAGGHLASMAATMFDERPEGATNDAIDQLSARPDVACPTYPVISMSEDFAHQGSRRNLLGAQDTDELARHVSTELRVTDKTPPIFLFQTDDDTVVPAENAVHFYLACRKHHVPAELHVYAHGPHGVGLMQGDPVLGTWTEHLAAWLRNQSFFSKAPRVAITGTVTLAGQPVGAGLVCFENEDPNAPRPSARFQGGKFALDAAHGVVVGKHRFHVTYRTPDGTASQTVTGEVSDGRAVVIELKQ